MKSVKTRDNVRKRNEENRKVKRYERTQNRENVVEEDINLGRVFESATGNKTYVKGLNLLEIKSEILLDYTGFFEMIGSMLIGEME